MGKRHSNKKRPIPFKKIISKIESTKIDSHKQIALNVPSETFVQDFSKEIVKQKINKNNSLTLLQNRLLSNSNFPYMIYDGEDFYLVKIEPEKMEKENKKQIKSYASKLKNDLERIEKAIKIKTKGIIYFTPFLLNGKKKRDVFSQNLPIRFVNLHYDENSLERRIEENKYDNWLYENANPENILKIKGTDFKAFHYCKYNVHPGQLKNNGLDKIIEQEKLLKEKCINCKHYEFFQTPIKK